MSDMNFNRSPVVALGCSRETKIYNNIGGGPSILMYTHYMKKPKYTYTLIYINIHKLSFYPALSVNHIMHLNDVFEELLHCINSFDGRFVDI